MRERAYLASIQQRAELLPKIEIPFTIVTTGTKTMTEIAVEDQHGYCLSTTDDRYWLKGYLAWLKRNRIVSIDQPLIYLDSFHETFMDSLIIKEFSNVALVNHEWELFGWLSCQLNQLQLAQGPLPFLIINNHLHRVGSPRKNVTGLLISKLTYLVMTDPLDRTGRLAECLVELVPNIDLEAYYASFSSGEDLTKENLPAKHFHLISQALTNSEV